MTNRQRPIWRCDNCGHRIKPGEDGYVNLSDNSTTRILNHVHDPEKYPPPGREHPWMITHRSCDIAKQHEPINHVSFGKHVKDLNTWFEVVRWMAWAAETPIINNCTRWDQLFDRFTKHNRARDDRRRS